MFEPAYSLYQVIGISFFLFLLGASIGAMIGKAAQRRHDIWMFGPKFMQPERRRATRALLERIGRQ